MIKTTPTFLNKRRSWLKNCLWQKVKRFMSGRNTGPLNLHYDFIHDKTTQKDWNPGGEESGCLFLSSERLPRKHIWTSPQPNPEGPEPVQSCPSETQSWVGRFRPVHRHCESGCSQVYWEKNQTLMSRREREH